MKQRVGIRNHQQELCETPEQTAKWKAEAPPPNVGAGLLAALNSGTMGEEEPGMTIPPKSPNLAAGEASATAALEVAAERKTKAPPFGRKKQPPKDEV